MAEDKSRNIEKIEIIAIFFIILSVFLFFLGKYVKVHMTEKLLSDNAILKEKLYDVNMRYLEIDKQLYELEDKIIDVSDVNVKITKLRTEVYQNARKLENEILNKKTDAKIAYLTFDDGPYLNTYAVLNILDKYDIKATFFMIGKDHVKDDINGKMDAVPVYKSVKDRGHTIANHTYSHKIKDGIYVSAESFLADVDKHNSYLASMGIPKPAFIRFPGGSPTAGNKKADIIKGLEERNMGWTDWTAADGDGMDIKDKDEAWKLFTTTINQNIEVVLFHDYSKTTLALLPKAIEYLRDKGYILLPLYYDSKEINK